MRKIIFSLIILILFFPITQIFAQEVSFSEKGVHESLELTIDKNGKVSVVHEIKDSFEMRQIDTIPGKVSNLKVIDVNNNEVEHGIIDDNRSVLLFPTQENVLIEYELGEVLFQKDSVWYWDFLYLESTTFVFPEDVDLIFTNNDPVLLKDARGITCHGCQMRLQYIINEEIIQQNIKWEEREFLVTLRTNADISLFSFNQPQRSIEFNVNDENKFVTLIIPLELLWNPYQVYLNDEQILKHEFSNNGTHVWLNVKPETTGKLQIIGTSVVPEFSVFLPLALAFSIVIVLQMRNKIILR